MAKKNDKLETETVVETVAADAAVLATTTPAGAVAVADDDDFGDFQGHQGKITADELVTERFRIVQAMTKNKRETGLVDGQIYGNISRKGMDSAVIVALHETRTIVERTGDSKGTFVREYVETEFGSNDFQDPTINALIKKMTFKNVYKAVLDNGNKLAPTYNCYVAFLDDTGTEVKGFGVLQADKTNIRPFTKWMQDRVAFEGANKTPLFAIRTRVDGKGTYENEEGNVTQQYRFSPFKDDNWKASRMSPKPKALGGNYELLKALEDHKKLVTGGAIKIAEYSDADDSEEAQEFAAF